ncbi:MAG: glycosyltransferase [Thermomicrobiales bacterium]
MGRLKILIWHIHGSYLNALCRIEHDWYLPIKPGAPEGYGGRAGYDLPPWVHEVPDSFVQDLDLDLVIYQTPRNLHDDAAEILGERQRTLPAIYLEHNIPRPHPVDSRHPVADRDLLLVHVTHFNRLMWDSGTTPVRVIEHSVAIDPTICYNGETPRGITIVNGLCRRGRLTGCDLFLQARERVPLDLVGMESEEIGGLGDIPYRSLHRRVADYRFLFSPIRYTSLPLAVIEAMTIGCPIVALATTELPTVIENGVNGYVSCDLDALVEGMRKLLADPDHARRLGQNARELARRRFGFARFARDWHATFELALNLGRSAGGKLVSDEDASLLAALVDE